MNYVEQTTAALREALEPAGRYPDPALIEASVERGDEIVPGLLAMLEAGVDKAWDEDDPRWYREVHAGLVLIALRAPEALPVPASIYPERGDTLVDYWFDHRPFAMGPPVVYHFQDLTLLSKVTELFYSKRIRNLSKGRDRKRPAERRGIQQEARV